MLRKFLLPTLLLISLILLIFYSEKNSVITTEQKSIAKTENYESTLNEVKNCLGKFDNCYQDIFNNLKNPDIHEINKVLGEASIKGELKGECHKIIHYLGVTRYKEVDIDKKIEPYCGAALLHALEIVYSQTGEEDKIKKIIINSCDKNDVEIMGMCYHGLGHAISNNENYQEGRVIEDCVKVTPSKDEITENDRKILIGQCIDGYIMELSDHNKNFSPDNYYFFEQRDLSLDEIYAKCRYQDKDYKNFVDDCLAIVYKYNSKEKIKNIENVSKFYHKVCKEGELFCASQAGSVASYRSMDYDEKLSAKTVEKICPKVGFDSCISQYLETYMSKSQKGLDPNFCSNLKRKEEAPNCEKFLTHPRV